MRLKAWIATLLMSSVTMTAEAADSALAQQLQERAQFWSQRGQTENALDAWRKLLKIEPNHSDALFALLQYEASQGHSELARAYYTRLKTSKASAAQLKLAEDLLNSGKGVASTQFEQARKLARQGDIESAISAYLQAAGGKVLQGEIAAEYLQVLASSKAHYDEALRGIAKLRQSAPTNRRYALLHAKVLTYRETTRLQGLQELAQLSRQTEVSKAAIEAWRETLSWMGNNPQTQQQLQNYLQRFPEDQQVRQQLRQLQQSQSPASDSHVAKAEPPSATPRSSSKRARQNTPTDAQAKDQASTASSAATASNSSRAFALLEKGEVKAAEVLFKALIKNQPRNDAGYGGLGLIRMREEQFIDARKLLRQAEQLSQRKADWQPALHEANYWATIAEAQLAFEDSETDKGIKLLKQAITIKPKASVAQLQLAEALRAENDSKGAEQYFREVLELEPQNIGALDGLIGLLAQQKRIAELDQLAPRMSERQLAVVANVKAAQFWEQAKDQQKAGDQAGAQKSLEQAILLTPENAWIRMDLARIFIHEQRPDLAIALLDALTEVKNPQSEALYARALLSAQLEQWYDCLLILERLPKLARQNESYALQKRAWLRVQLQRYQSLLALDRGREARDLLKQIENASAGDAEFAGTVALNYVQAGQADYALKLMQDFMQKAKPDDVHALLQYAIVLLRLKREQDLLDILDKISGLKLTAEEQAQFNDLRGVYALQRAEQARNQGELALAYRYLQPFLLSDPDNPLLLLALVQLYHSAEDDAAAAELFQPIAEADYRQPEVVQAIVYAAMALKEWEIAEANLQLLMQLQKPDVATLSLAGQLARARGNPDQALAYFKQALAMQQAARGGENESTPSTRIKAKASSSPNLRDFSKNPFDQQSQPAPRPGSSSDRIKEPSQPLLRKVKFQS